MRKIVVFLCLALLLFSLAACNRAVVLNPAFLFDESGSYTGFAAIPADYTASQAVKDGCYVSRNLNEVGGGGAWSAFIAKAKAGGDCSIRIMSIYDDGTYYEDLFYVNGRYSLFDSSAEDLTAHISYKYLLDLRGRMPNASADSRYVVLTDDGALTFDDVWKSMVSDNSAVAFSHQYVLVCGMAA